MKNSPTLQAMPESRRAILSGLKRRGSQSIASLAGHLGITPEGVRQHLGQLQHEGWVKREVKREPSTAGRPPSVYRLTPAGDHLFPKEYDDLAVALIDAAAEELGREAVRRLLERVARDKVEQWEPQLRGLGLKDRLKALRDIYMADDPYCYVESEENGHPRLVEMNCPYLEVARRRPALCSVTVSVLRRLLGYRVVRTERFQSGHGRCVFRILKDHPLENGSSLFEWEPDEP
ncbi:MAG TPA: winged helix-turn-helix transcriptional regulator [Acidobacteriota bacterium]|nr:winged helix-turn-helix transcriptional regulator [Acidobacteriota bacterium]